MTNKEKTPKNVPQRCMKCTYHPINIQGPPEFPPDRKEIASGKELTIALENIKKRMNYVNETEDIPCYACQGGGCPVCMGYGYLTQSIDLEQKILNVLWSLRQDDKFYFMSYGKELLKRIRKGEM